MPRRVVPDLGQRSENDVQPSMKQRCHVLQEDDFRSNHVNRGKRLPEETGAVPVESGASPGE